MTYFDTLYSASYNGAPFFVRRARDHFGRRVTVHKYPFRDTSWPEDLGRRPREFEIEGFLVGDDVINQAAFMRTVCEITGTGVLIHPILGIQVVQLMDFTSESGFDHGREIRVNFKFIEAGQRLFSALTTALGGNTLTASDNALTAFNTDFIGDLGTALSAGAQVALKAAITAATLVAVAQAAIKSASNIGAGVSSLSGPFGRNAGGATGSGASSIVGTVASVGGTVALAAEVTKLLNINATNQNAAADAGASLISTAGGL